MDITQKKQQALKLNDKLKELYPDPKVPLNYATPFELLVAVILSAQCTDKMVNIVTAKLFKKYPTLEDYVNAKQEEFEQDIKSTGFYKNKAKNVLATARMIAHDFGGKVPDTMQELLVLPGVARKTANVVLGHIYGKQEGVVVDTHVKRLTKLLNLTDKEDPVRIEQDLIHILPEKERLNFSLRLILYGREYCTARPHDHATCPLTQV